MKLSKGTLEILKAATAVNNEIVLNKGNEIRITKNGYFIMIAEIEEAFPQRFGISDLGNFINVISSLKDDFELEFPSVDRIQIKSGKTKILYAARDPETIREVKGKPKVPFNDIDIFITDEILNQIEKFSSFLGKLPTLKFESDGTSPKIKIYDKKDERNTSLSKNVCEIEISEENPKNEPYSFILNEDVRLKLIPGSYTIKFNDRMVRFKNDDRTVEYYVGLSL